MSTDIPKCCSNDHQDNDNGTGQELPTEKADTPRPAKIRELNDKLRIHGVGGIVLITNGVAALGAAAVREIFVSLAAFCDFTEDNDPWGEHDCAVMTVGDHKIIWKIDYYDRSRRYLSPDPSDPKITLRVLTVMLSSEY
jgi:hypothetical protein